MLRIPWLARRRRRRPAVSDQARAARERASADLARVRARSGQVDRTVGYLREQAARNNWSARLAAAWRGVPDG